MDGNAETALAELTQLAVTRDWTDVTDFAAAVGQPLVALEGNGAPVAELAGRLGRDGVPTLALGGPEPVDQLAYDRVLITLRCGEPLTPAESAAIRRVRLREPGEHLVVITGCDVLSAPGDLE